MIGWPSYAVGGLVGSRADSDVVPINAHKGEVVVNPEATKSLSKQLQSGTFPAKGDTHITVSAIDAMSFQDYWSGNGYEASRRVALANQGLQGQAMRALYQPR